jgi:hypothetical protein
LFVSLLILPQLAVGKLATDCYFGVFCLLFFSLSYSLVGLLWIVYPLLWAAVEIYCTKMYHLGEAWEFPPVSDPSGRF